MIFSPPPPTDPAVSPRLDDRLSFLCGQWLPHGELSVAVDDTGFRQGVVAVERLRTYAGRIFAVGNHLDRWKVTTTTLGIEGLPSRSETELLMDQLLERNLDWIVSRGDVGITLFSTPGVASGPADSGARPTFGLHLNPLNHERIGWHREQGQPLVVTDVIQPDPACWPRTIKTRSRIHYYLADQAARRQHPDAVGVLLDHDATITETSIANLAIVRSGEVFSPPPDRVLGGITQSLIESLAQGKSIRWNKRPISTGDLSAAEEILMMGTDGGIWFANSVDGVPVADGKPGPLFVHLRRQFDRLVADRK